MATVQRASMIQYPDGQVAIHNIRKKRLSIPVFGPNESYSATLVNSWWDGTPMDDSKADGSVYFKLKKLPEGADSALSQYIGSYFKVNLPNDGEYFLEKDTMQEMRDLSSTEILLLQMGYYKGVKLNGYYSESDTPAPIEYYLSETTEADDGGSVIQVGEIKLEHEFVGDINVTYFGGVQNSDLTPIISIVDLKYKSNLVLNDNVQYDLSDITYISNVGLVGMNSTIRMVGSSSYGIYTRNLNGKSIKGITFDLNNTELVNRNCALLVTENTENCLFENINFINAGSFTAIPSIPPLLLVSKDVEDDYSVGGIGYVKNNVFRNITVSQKEGHRSAFAIRLVSNWLKERPLNETVNRTEFNTFDNIVVTGDYLWNLIELAGTGTVNNIIENCRIKGRAITAIDLDKGTSYNTVRNNHVELSLSSYADQAESSFVFAPINNHGSSLNLINYGNIIVGNTLNNCGQLHSNLSPLEACIGLQYVDGGEVSSNFITNTFNGVCGIHFLSDVKNFEIRNNTTKNIISRAITTNANQGGNDNIKIINNNFESNNTSIFLSGISISNKNIIVSNNSLRCINSSTGAVILTSTWENSKIVNNYIYNTGDKIVNSSATSLIAGNTYDGTSSYSIRTNADANIIDNISLVTTLGLVGSSATTSRQWNNSWNPAPVLGDPYYRNDGVVWGNDASVVPSGFWSTSKSITISTISSGIGFPTSEGLLTTYQNGGGATAGNYSRTYDIFKSYNVEGLYYRRYSSSGNPQPFIRIDNVNASISVKGVVNQGVTVTDATDEVDAVTKLNALLSSLRTAGIIAT